MPKNAIAKIQTEMNQNANNHYIQAVGGHLLQHLEANPESAEKILVQDKTIGKSLDAMRKAAEAKKVGNCAVLTDQEGFAVVLKYFGIETDGKTVSSTLPPPAPPVAKDSVDFNVSLDDLL